MSGALPFVAFVRDVLRVKLTPAQHALASVAFDGKQPGELQGEAREMARRIFGDIEAIPPEARHVVVAVCGARAGKSYVLCGLRLLWGALTRDLSTMAPGEIACALIVAPDLRLARQTLRYALGAAERVPEIKRRIRSQSADGFVLEREKGRTVSIECLPATRGGSALRGRSLTDAVLDESAFFRDDSYQVNDAELFKAVAPRVLRGGQVVVASTPWAEAGLLFDLFRANHPDPSLAGIDATAANEGTAIAAHAPTTLLRDDERTRGLVDRERKRDPENAAREFDAQFMPAGSGAFFDPAAIAKAVDTSLVVPFLPVPGAEVTVGADFGFRSDSSALVIVHRTGDLRTVASVLEKCPKKGTPLQPGDVVRDFAAETKRHGAGWLMADGHYRESISEHLYAADLGLVAAPEGATGKADAYIKARTLLLDGRIRLPDHSRLLRQLKEVVSKPTAGGGVSISSPRWRTGGHGDLVSALVLAFYPASGHHTPGVYRARTPAEVIRSETDAFWSKQAEQINQTNAEERRLADEDARWGMVE